MLRDESIIVYPLKESPAWTGKTMLTALYWSV